MEPGRCPAHKGDITNMRANHCYACQQARIHASANAMRRNQIQVQQEIYLRQAAAQAAQAEQQQRNAQIAQNQAFAMWRQTPDGAAFADWMRRGEAIREIILRHDRLVQNAVEMDWQKIIKDTRDPKNPKKPAIKTKMTIREIMRASSAELKLADDPMPYRLYPVRVGHASWGDPGEYQDWLDPSAQSYANGISNYIENMKIQYPPKESLLKLGFPRVRDIGTIVSGTHGEQAVRNYLNEVRSPVAQKLLVGI